MRFKLLLFLVVLIFCFSVTAALADDYQFNANKEWENSLLVGFKSFDRDYIKDSGTVGLRFQKRIGYPFLAGLEAEASIIGNIGYIRAGIPFSIRIPMPVERTKLDVTLSPGGVYATNLDTDVKDLGGAATAGLEAKYFFKSGYSFGIGAYYTVTTNKLNNFNIVAVFGF